jgi:hypothetical protein
MAVPTDIFTPETFFTLGGSALAIWLVTTVIASVAGSTSQPYLRWISLVLAEALALLAVWRTGNPDVIAWVVAVFNGLIIYLTAVGVNNVTSRTAEDRGPKGLQQAGENWRGPVQTAWWR